jgi:transcriptional regulator with XRE-family HTH domain
MANMTCRIADKVHKVAVGAGFTQQKIADVLNLSRTSVSDRIHGRIPFTATEIFILAGTLQVKLEKFFPDEVAPVEDAD